MRTYSGSIKWEPNNKWETERESKDREIFFCGERGSKFTADLEHSNLQWQLMEEMVIIWKTIAI